MRHSLILLLILMSPVLYSSPAPAGVIYKKDGLPTRLPTANVTGVSYDPPLVEWKTAESHQFGPFISWGGLNQLFAECRSDTNAVPDIPGVRLEYKVVASSAGLPLSSIGTTIGTSSPSQSVGFASGRWYKNMSVTLEVPTGFPPTITVPDGYPLLETVTLSCRVAFADGVWYSGVGKPQPWMNTSYTIEQRYIRTAITTHNVVVRPATVDFGVIGNGVTTQRARKFEVYADDGQALNGELQFYIPNPAPDGLSATFGRSNWSISLTDLASGAPVKIDNTPLRIATGNPSTRTRSYSVNLHGGPGTFIGSTNAVVRVTYTPY